MEIRFKIHPIHLRKLLMTLTRHQKTGMFEAQDLSAGKMYL